MEWDRHETLMAVWTGGAVFLVVGWVLPWLVVPVDFSMPWGYPGFLIFPDTQTTIGFHFDLGFWFWGVAMESGSQHGFASWFEVALEGDGDGVFRILLGNVLGAFGVLAGILGWISGRIPRLTESVAQWLRLGGAVGPLLGVGLVTWGLEALTEYEVSVSDWESAFWLSWFGALFMAGAGGYAWWVERPALEPEGYGTTEQNS